MRKLFDLTSANFSSRSYVCMIVWKASDLLAKIGEMPVLVMYKFDEDRIKTEGVSVETSFSANVSSLKGK